jgi:glyceraldehyde 3-phosphate dehydrogenase
LAGNNKINVFNIDNPSEIPWSKTGADVVIDSTGKFRTISDLNGHLKGGAKYVVLSAPAKDNTKTLVYGINENYFNHKSDKIISNSSCTTNCLTTTIKVLHKTFGVKRGFMTTVHSVTDSQNLLDNSHKKEVRLRRSAFASMIPSSTGSAKDVGKLFPDLAGKIMCQSLRIPLLTVSLVNLTVELGKTTTRENINKEYEKAAGSYLKSILAVSRDELVSKDYTGNPHSSIIDTYLTQVSGGNLANIFAWYDNEWGYTNRLVDMVFYIGKKGGLI